MSRVYVVIVILVLLALPISAIAEDDKAGTEERALIEMAVRDYIDGWYEGSAERMERALHPDLVKRRVRGMDNGRQVLSTVSASSMVEYTRAGGGTKQRQEGQKNEVTILDVSSHTASVKTVSPDFIDYIHLAKLNGQWRIVNVLWEPVPKPR